MCFFIGIIIIYKRYRNSEGAGFVIIRNIDRFCGFIIILYIAI